MNPRVLEPVDLLPSDAESTGLGQQVCRRAHIAMKTETEGIDGGAYY
jgi:hypothetical protein